MGLVLVGVIVAVGIGTAAAVGGKAQGPPVGDGGRVVDQDSKGGPSSWEVAAAPEQGIEGPPPLADGQVHRLAGPNRFITGADAAQRLWFDGADTAVVATGLDYPDAAAGAAVAAVEDAPMLLAATDHLPDSVPQTIARRDPERVLLLGGEAALSAQLAREVEGLPGSPDVDRIAGPHRFATAESATAAAGGLADRDVAVVDGGVYADALAAGSLAAGDPATPVVLASDEAVEADISPASRALLVGGRLGPAVVDDAAAQVDTVRQLAGATRWDTSLQVADFTLTERVSGDAPLVVATGQGFADGLSAAAGLMAVVPPTIHAPVSCWW
jgi:putative cell wall-binding protein